METNELELWQKIQAFELDEAGVAFKFSDRLARENGWTKGYAKRVVEEYKKFIFLCCVSEQGVTPSDPVDQAWHLHLTFTRSYWTDLCQDTLGKQIHHNPTKGGKQEAAKFDGFYTSSHKLYADKFGMQPPADVWQDNHTRFSDINFQRVNMGRYWLIRKPRFSFPVVCLFALMVTLLLFIQATDVSYIVSVLFIGVFGILLIRSMNKNNGNSGCGGNSCGTGGGDSHHSGGHHGGDSGCGSGCSGCSGSGCSGCGGGGD